MFDPFRFRIRQTLPFSWFHGSSRSTPTPPFTWQNLLNSSLVHEGPDIRQQCFMLYNSDKGSWRLEARLRKARLSLVKVLEALIGHWRYASKSPERGSGRSSLPLGRYKVKEFLSRLFCRRSGRSVMAKLGSVMEKRAACSLMAFRGRLLIRNPTPC